MSDKPIIQYLQRLIFGHRPVVITVFVVITLLMGWFATQLRIDAGFAKMFPLQHQYMKTFVKYREEFGGANRVLIAIMSRDRDMFTPAFFKTLKAATDEVFFISGVDRSRVKSLFTPNVRFTEVVVGGIAGGNVVPAEFQPTEEGLARVRENILKAGIIGRLVANDFSGAIVYAELLEFNPDTGQRLDFVAVARDLEDKVRDRFSDGFTQQQFDIHIIGFAKIVGDIADSAVRIVLFLTISFWIIAFLLYLYSASVRMTMMILACSAIAVTWQLGTLTLLGFGIDPMLLPIPFLIGAICVSHGVQMVSAARAEIYNGADAQSAARESFRRLALPGAIALASDTAGFVTIMLIDIGIIREMAITASLGVAVIIFTNLILLPVLISYFRGEERYRDKLHQRAEVLAPLWRTLSMTATRGPATLVLVVAGGLLVLGLWKGADVKIGDLHRGVPELRPDSRYNIDASVIADRFSIGVDVLTVFVETVPEGCIKHEYMEAIDQFAWHMSNVPGVSSTQTLPMIAKVINAGWNEGSLKWRVLPRNQHALVQATSPVDTSSGLLNRDCSVMPVLMYTEDHKAETIERVVGAVKQYDDKHGDQNLRFRLAGGNVAVMAATNEAVKEAQFPMLVYVFSAIVLLCLLSFRTLTGTLCIVIPLILVSLLAYALMSWLGIGLKVNTLPVVALGVGIGVDYGIYIFSRFQSLLDEGKEIAEAYYTTLAITGVSVIVTGCTLAMGVAAWIFSPLQLQADMGILLTFMFLMNMLGAILLLPALAFWMFHKQAGAPSSG
jgi:predicted RND superfamily exporter protein